MEFAKYRLENSLILQLYHPFPFNLPTRGSSRPIKAVNVPTHFPSRHAQDPLMAPPQKNSPITSNSSPIG